MPVTALARDDDAERRALLQRIARTMRAAGARQLLAMLRALTA